MNNICFQVNSLNLAFGKYAHKALLYIEKGKSKEKIFNELNCTAAINNVNISVFYGEILVIMGASGSGKSSLLRCFNGINGRTNGAISGNIKFFDNTTKENFDILNCPKNKITDIRKHKISMVFQNFALMPWRTVEENIAYPLEIQKIKKTEIKNIVYENLNIVGLSQWKHKYPEELSGGMQQRVGIARAFVTNAEILLMDEPFSALDPLNRKNLQDEILQFKNKLKKTIIFVSHDFKEAVKLGTRIAIMDSGKILQIGTPKEIIENPKCDVVKKFTENETGYLN
jgi:glycine betaine/proline transport system ATP-binding protein